MSHPYISHQQGAPSIDNTNDLVRPILLAQTYTKYSH